MAFTLGVIIGTLQLIINSLLLVGVHKVLLLNLNSSLHVINFISPSHILHSDRTVFFKVFSLLHACQFLKLAIQIECYCCSSVRLEHKAALCVSVSNI